MPTGLVSRSTFSCSHPGHGFPSLDSTLNAELLCLLRAQSLPVVELHRVGTNHAAERGAAEQVVQHIEANVPPGSTHRDVAPIDVGPQRQARAATDRFECWTTCSAEPRSAAWLV